MKRIGLLLPALLFCANIHAQDAFYERVKASVAEMYPQTDLTGKILCVTLLGDDAESRENAKSADQVAGIYKVAKLRGGSEGLVSVAITRNISEPAAVITLQNDGVKNTLLLNGGATLDSELQNAPKNVVFDSSGKELYRNLPPTAVFNSILQLITR